MPTEQTRVSVGLTREEYEQVHKLARRCNTSASALGQLGYKHLLLKAENGTIPMLPPEPVVIKKSAADLIRERSSAGIAFWCDEEVMTVPDSAPGLFSDTDLGRPTMVLFPAPETPAPPEQLRISVGLTRDELDQVQSLGRRCNTSASALGQLAYRHLLSQARNGAIPLLPVSTVETAELVERLTNEDVEAILAKDNLNKAQDELDRLIELTSGES